MMRYIQISILVVLVTFSEAIVYEIKVKTGDVEYAGTGARVFLTMYGSDNRDTGSQVLLKENSLTEFLRNTNEKITLKAPAIGEIEKIKIRHDNTLRNPEWFLDKVIIDVLSEGRRYEFVCNCWLASDEGGGLIERELPVTKSEYKFGFNNFYTCHCLLDGPCDKVTGNCSGSCSDGWMGPSCQQENVAYKSKHVNQSGELDNGNRPENAVDGMRSRTGVSVFDKWWFIDLQRNFSIGYLKTFTFNDLSNFKGFSVHIDNELCFKHNGESDPPDEYLIECDNIITGRYVNITNGRHAGGWDYVNLLEVEIYVCSRGTYGSDCNNFCHCSNYDECNVKTGQCPNGCQIGWFGDNCNSTIPILKKISISFVTNLVWDNRMTNDQSQEYKQMKQKIEENFMDDLLNVRGLAGIEIINMRPGSVICDGVIFVNENGTIHNTSEIFLDQVNTGKMGNLTVKDGMIYQGDQHIFPATLTLRGGDPDMLLEGTVIEYACKFRLVSINGVIKPNVRWFLDDTLLIVTHTPRIKMRNSTESEDKFGYQYIIQFDKAISSHSGLLKCMVESSTNSSIHSSANETVKIIPKPVVTLWPLSTFLQGGESVTLKCSSSSSPVTYSWFDAKTDSEIELAGNEDVYNVTAVDKDIQVYCTAGNLAGTTQSLTATIYYVSATDDSVTCTSSSDTRNTTWPSVKAGSSVKLSCGEEYSDEGLAQRQCSESGDWSQSDYSNCKRSKLIGLKRRTDDVKEGKLVTTPERTLKNLANLTNDGKQFSAGDVEISVQILMDVVDIIKGDSTVEIGEPELKNFVQSASNILEADDEEWKTLAEQDKSGIAVMMDTVDAMAKLSSSRLENRKSITASTDKMVIEIGKFDESSNDIEFPRPSSKAYPDWTNTSYSKGLLRKETFANDNEDINDISYSAVFYNDISKIVEGRILVPGESMDSKNNETVAEINGKILAVSVYPTPKKKLDPPIELSFQHLSDKYPSISCVFLDLTPPYNKRGRWSTEGCKTESTSNPNVTICKCDHLTNFAILMSPAITPIKHRKALSIISAIGCAISLFCLLLTVVVYVCFWRYVKSDKAIILMNLCVTLIIAYIIFFGGVNRTDSKAWCQAVAVLLHFFFLVVFFLMLAEGVQVLISVVALFTTSKLKWILTASWGIPVVIVVISVAVTQLEGYGNEDYCWLSFGSGLLWAFIGPALAVILVNVAIVIKVLIVMFSTKNMVTKSTIEKGRAGLKALCVLLPIIGLTWVFGVFSVNSYTVIFQYLFAIFNSLQGLFIFIFHCCMNDKLIKAIQIKRRQYKAQSFDTGTKTLTESNQTKNTYDKGKVTSL